VEATPFKEICYKGDLESLKKMLPPMLDKISTEDEVSIEINHGFRIAVTYNHLDLTRYFSSLQNNEVKAWMEKKVLLLNFLCLAGHLEIVKMFIEDNPNLDISDSLKLACFPGHIEIIKFLLALPGTNTIVKGHTLNSPNSLLYKTGNYEAFDLFLCHPRVTFEDFNDVVREEMFPAKQQKMFTVLRASRFPLLLSKSEELQAVTIQLGPHTTGSFVEYQDVEVMNLINLNTCDEETKSKLLEDKLQARKELNKDAEIFAFTILLADGYLEFDVESEKTKDQNLRFFKILLALPLDLKMMSCKRVYLQKTDVYLPSEVNRNLNNVIYKFFS